MKSLFPVCIVTVALLAACGGGGGTKNNPPPPPPPPPTTPTCTVGAAAPVNPPTLVSVAGADATGVDITVGAPQTCPQANAEVLGVADLSATRLTANNTGAQVRRGESKIVILFGKGLSGNMQVSIGGQNDFTITNVQGVTATDGTPGIQFTIAVSFTAALGARSVSLRPANGDITTFTGGLEVIP